MYDSSNEVVSLGQTKFIQHTQKYCILKMYYKSFLKYNLAYLQNFTRQINKNYKWLNIKCILQICCASRAHCHPIEALESKHNIRLYRNYCHRIVMFGFYSHTLEDLLQIKINLENIRMYNVVHTCWSSSKWFYTQKQHW